MLTQTWIYDAILYIYALSLLFYFSDFASANRSAKRIGTGLLVFVWILQTAFFVMQLGSLRSFSAYETLFFYSWMLVTVSLLVSRFARIELFVFFVNLVGFAVLALNFFSKPGAVPTLEGWHITDELLFIHVSLAIASYTAFLAAAIFSGMYLFLHRKLKDKKWGGRMKRLPSLETMDQYAWTTVLTGFPLLMLALALGLAWLVLQGSDHLLLDPKVLSSLVLLAVYAAVIVSRSAFQASRQTLAKWILAAFVLVLINFLLSNWLSGFHQWIWM
ncbi:protein HemX [Paenibacillus sp. J31TS4]|uniref:cytochrome C assembly family protein n=1 Tax=Paenibacillus sp. J31TS4 TaxID=2807195 RepID=UPI001B14C144|nr:cytochrome c biogenesis protein CcsA [Paenibacillus sp. J31TS4]GIP39176.1 protein HemX [Paenibacillus sp. J31TS4]